MNELGGGSMWYMDSVSRKIFFRHRRECRSGGGGTVVFGDESFDALELFAGSMMFVQVNAEAFSVEAGRAEKGWSSRI